MRERERREERKREGREEKEGRREKGRMGIGEGDTGCPKKNRTLIVPSIWRAYKPSV